MGIAEGGCDGISCYAWNLGHGIGNDLPILNVKSFDLFQWRSDELRHNGELGVCVDGFAFSVERGVAHAVRVEIAPVGVAGSSVAVAGVGPAARITRASGLADCAARVWCYGCSHVVCFPDVHFGAAGAKTAYAGVFVRGRGFPADRVALVVVLVWISVELWWRGEKLTSPLIHFRSRGHWASQ